MGQPQDMKHLIVFGEEGRFCGWPANNGVWSWPDDEILVGFSNGPWVEKKGHNIGEPILSFLGRSCDGGETWSATDPQNYVGDGGVPRALPGAIDFAHPDFAMRIVGTGYHGTDDPRGGFFFSNNRGFSWSGPFTFGDLPDCGELEGKVMTPRTDYLVLSPQDCLIFMAVKDISGNRSDRTFCVRTTDGGLSFEFVSWIVPYQDRHRAVMPAAVRISDWKIAVAVRRRDLDKKNKRPCWIDAYASEDGGTVWNFRSRVGETGRHNGNPPALLRLGDGRLCCIYGNRDKREIRARLSRDEGHSWGDERILRSDFQADSFDDPDLGYPRAVERSDGRILTFYYWATAKHPHNHIAATIWDPE